MSTASLESISGSTIAIVVGVMLATITIFLLIQGLVMRFSIHVCGGEETGLMYSIFVVICSTVCSVIATFCLVAFTEEPSPGTSLLCGVLGSTAAIALLNKMDPLRSFGVYVVYTVTGTLCVVILSFMFMAGFYALVPSERMQEWAKAGDRFAKQAQIAAAQSSQSEKGSESRATDDLLATVKAQWTSLTGGGNSPQVDPSSTKNSKEMEKLTGVKFANQNGSSATSTGNQQAAGSEPRVSGNGTASEKSPATNKKKPAEVTDPFGGTYRTNPYAK